MSEQIDYMLVLLGTVVILATAATLAFYIVLSTKRELATRMREEETLRKSREQLRNLSTYLQSAREEERTEVAREIHDGLGQLLTAIKMDISWLNKKLPNVQNGLAEKAASMIKLIDNAMLEVKQISARLRPAILDDLGIEPALEWEVSEFIKRMGIECRLKTNLEKLDIDRDLATVIYRITQESLTNIARHAQATEVEINLRYDSDLLLLEINDNGVGITKEQVSNPKSFGLLGIGERVLQYGGNLDICGVKETGTQIRISLPV